MEVSDGEVCGTPAALKVIAWEDIKQEYMGCTGDVKQSILAVSIDNTIYFKG